MDLEVGAAAANVHDSFVYAAVLPRDSLVESRVVELYCRKQAAVNKQNECLLQ